MTISEALRTYLLTKASVTNLVSTRIHPQRSKQGVPYPRVTYEEQGGERTRSLDGANGQIQTSFQISCWSKDYDTANDIAEALRNVLECYRGLMGSVEVQGVFVEPPNNFVVPSSTADDESIHHVSIEVTIWYEEAVPTYV